MMSRKTWSYCGNDCARSGDAGRPKLKNSATIAHQDRADGRCIQRFIEAPFFATDVRDLCAAGAGTRTLMRESLTAGKDQINSLRPFEEILKRVTARRKRNYKSASRAGRRKYGLPVEQTE